jgi:hypothetical protein
MNYKEKIKIQLMREALEDFKSDFGKSPEIFFTKKDNFYFIKHKNTKYIHKKSLKLIYTNYDTFTKDLNPNTCKLKKEIIPFSLCKLNLPEASKHFYQVPWLYGDIITEINKDDFYHIKNKWRDINFTPFYNQMVYNLIKNSDGIFIIDYKHFENIKDLPFFIYFYNKNHNINILYYENDIKKIKKHLEIDYPIQEAKYVKFTKE